MSVLLVCNKITLSTDQCVLVVWQSLPTWQKEVMFAVVFVICLSVCLFVHVWMPFIHFVLYTYVYKVLNIPSFPHVPANCKWMQKYNHHVHEYRFLLVGHSSICVFPKIHPVLRYLLLCMLWPTCMKIVLIITQEPGHNDVPSALLQYVTLIDGILMRTLWPLQDIVEETTHKIRSANLSFRCE